MTPTGLIILGVLALFFATAFGGSITLPVAHYRRPDGWWQHTKKRDVTAGLANLRPPDVWTVNVSVGSPPQVFSVNVDTGSTDLLIATPECAECNTVSGLRFDPQLSSSFSALSCSDDLCVERCTDCKEDGAAICLFNNTYGDGSWAAGDVSVDVVAIGNLSTISPVTFGSLSATTPDFYINASVSGIFGLAFESSSCWGQTSAIHRLFAANPTVYRSFSFCFLPDGGQMIIGETFEVAGVTPTQPVSTIPYLWTPYSTQVFAGYGVNMQDIQVGGRSIGVSISRLTIIDSGTTLVTIPAEAYRALTSALLDQCTGTACDLFAPTDFFLPATLEDVQSLPPISFVFAGVSLTLGPTQYLSAASNAQDLWFFLIVPTSGTPIIGNQVMKYFRTAFDLENERIGFANVVTSCDGGSVWAPGGIVSVANAPRERGLFDAAAGSARVCVTLLSLCTLLMFLYVY